nr:MAG TPA: nucleoporin [Caudoviricetes sp.]
MSKTLDIIMSLKDDVSPSLGKMNSNLQTTSGKLNAVGKSVGKLGGIIKGALVGGAIAKFSYDCLKAYDVQIQAEKSVQRALEKTGKTSVEAQQGLKEFKEFASKQQDITAFGDEGTLQVISGLISQGFGKKSIEDIVAMSQDIARSTGDEQENVTKALSAYVKTGKGATKLAKAYKLNADLLGNGATESERLAEVWKAFSQSSHMGASTEYLKTFEGQLTAVQGRLDDMKEPVGELINQLLGGNSEGLSGSAGALASLQEVIVNATSDIQNMANRSSELGGGISNVGVACAEAHPYVTAFMLALAGGKTISMLATLISSLGTVAGAVTAVAGAIATCTAGAVALAGAIAGVITYLTIAIGKMSDYYQASAETRAELNATQLDSVGNFGQSVSLDSPSHSWFDRNATGTDYFQGGWTAVNENGGEIMNLPNGTQIIPHDVSAKMGGGYTINVPVTIQGNVIGNSEFIDEVGNAISNRVSLAIANM